MKISIITVFAIAVLCLTSTQAADETKDVPNLAEHASITARDSWVSKTPGVLSRKDSYRISTLEFDHEQSVEGYTFSSIAMVFDSDKLTTINFGGSLRESLPMKKGEIKLSCNGQVLVKQGDNEVPILLYAPGEDNPFPRFVGSKITDENAASGWITITDSQQKELKLPLLKFRVGETLVRCVIADASAMDNPTNKVVSPNAHGNADVTGKWELTYNWQTPGLAGESTMMGAIDFDLSQRGNTINGTTGGGRPATVTGTVEGATVKLTVQSSDPVAAFSGNIADKNTMKGTIDYYKSLPPGKGTWTAVRVK